MISWFYVQNGQRFGPVDEETVRKLYKAKSVNLQTLVWNKSFQGDWKPLSESGIGLPDIEWDEFSPPPLPEKPSGKLSSNQLFFSFRGRINRQNFISLYIFLVVVLGSVIFICIASFPHDSGDDFGKYFVVICGASAALLSVWISFALTAKRLHDMGFSALHLIWIQLINSISGPIAAAAAKDHQLLSILVILVPVAIGVWVMATPGQSDANAYGPPPENPIVV